MTTEATNRFVSMSREELILECQRLSIAAQQDADDRAGIAWWNGLSDDDRKKWVQPSGRAKDAWEVYKSDNRDGAREARLVDRKARAFLTLAPKIGEDDANLVLALLLNAGLQIVGPEQSVRVLKQRQICPP